ncbi:hypothetical protein LINGRAPRIM_LOCUS943 [Linum grandiflorum]
MQLALFIIEFTCRGRILFLIGYNYLPSQGINYFLISL